MRKEHTMTKPDQEIEANLHATNVVMHKDSVWNQQWESFKNSKVGEREIIFSVYSVCYVNPNQGKRLKFGK